MSSMFRRPTHPHPSNPNSPATSSTKTRKSIDASPSTLSISSIAGDSPEKRRRHLPSRGEMLHSISPIGDIGPMTMPKNGSVHIRREDLSPTEVSPELGVATAAPTSRNSGEHSEMYNISDGSSPHSSIRSRSSSHDSPGSRTSPTLPGEKERKRHSPRTKHGSSSARMKSPEDSDRRRRVATERDRKKVSPLYKRLGEEPPFMLPHPSRMEQTSQTYPGVVIGAFSDGDNSAGLGFGVNGMRFDSSMDDIMDIKAAPAPQGRNDSTGGLMGANIAPWLTDDTPSMPDSRAEQAEQPAQPIPKESPRKGSIQALNHFASLPALPRTKRHTTASSVAQNPNASSSRSGSQPNILPGSGAPDARASSNRSKDTSRSRAGSGDSVQTFAASQPQLAKTGSSPSVESSASPSQLGRQASVAAGNRGSRFGSTASNISGAGSVGSDKKKGFLGGLLKRKTGASSSMSKSTFAVGDMLIR